MLFEKDLILEALRVLDRKDPSRRVFGSTVHQYRLNPPLSTTLVEAFEARHGIALPADYKFFITDIGNGGAGPYYGLFRLGEHDNGDGQCQWADGRLVGNLAEPFPHDEAWNLPKSFWNDEPAPPPGTPPEEEDRQVAEWDKRLDEHYWNPSITRGAIPLCHRGCALRQWLVVTGNQKGYVWNDDRADNGGLYPLWDADGKQVTFSDWYVNWLDAAKEQPVVNKVGRQRHWNVSHHFSERVFLYAMVIGLVPGLVFAHWHDWARRLSIFAGLATAAAAVALVAGIDRILVEWRKHTKKRSQQP